MKKLFVLLSILLVSTNLFAWQYQQQPVKDEFGDVIYTKDYYFEGVNNNDRDDKYIMLYFNENSFLNGCIFTSGIGVNDSMALGDCQIKIKGDLGEVTVIESECEVSSYSDDWWCCEVKMNEEACKIFTKVLSQNNNPNIIITRDDVVYPYGKVDCSSFYNKSSCIKGNHCVNEDLFCDVCYKDFSNFINMVKIEGGKLLPNDKIEYDENNTMRVILSDFYLADSEVTQYLYKLMMDNNPSNFKGDLLPLETVSWYDAVEFCNKLSDFFGYERCYSINGDNIKYDYSKNGFRLPTSAEWEYAARGGNLSKGYLFSGSDDIDEVAWYDRNSDGKTHEIKTKKPNELGLYDMSGNVWEWCLDWYSYKGFGEGMNPQGAISGSARVERGGSWNSNLRYCGTSYFGGSLPKDIYNVLGFRVARSII